jgi:predicted ArsR family transcriptional regulator
MAAASPRLQEQARALGDPTRHEIFRYVAGARAPVDVAELTDHFGFNHNAIRQHLAKLVAADLLVQEQAPTGGRGRPRLVYRVDPSAESRWGVTGPYERLSLLLAEIVRTGAPPVEVGRRAAARVRGTGPHDDPVEMLVAAMAQAGFDPAVRDRGGQLEVVLQTCPFASTASADPDTVCAIHLGLAQGIADQTADQAGRLVIDELVPHDPRRANCQLRVHVEPEDA